MSTLASEIPQTIPPTHPHRTLVLCFDGTCDKFDNDNSNIVELFGMLKKDDTDKQMVYYQAGLGTYARPTIWPPLVSKFTRGLDAAIAWNLDTHVREGYKFLMQYHRPGDHICIFGFSRGAYTACTLAGMLKKVGLLPPGNNQQVKYAYKLFRRGRDDHSWKQSDLFKKQFAAEVKIQFLGVWDMVNSVGFSPRRLPFTKCNPCVRTFRHALALDERRAKFKPQHWDCQNSTETAGLMEMGAENPMETAVECDEQTLQVPGEMRGDMPSPNPSLARSFLESSSDDEILRQMEEKNGHLDFLTTDAEEVWFAGAHADVGGGSVANGTPNTLARISLRWMIRECFKSNSGIMFNSDTLRSIGLDPNSLYPYVTSRLSIFANHDRQTQSLFFPGNLSPGSEIPWSVNQHNTEEKEEEEEEEEELLRDALSPIYDRLNRSTFWWILEILPFRNLERLNTADAHPRAKLSHCINLGRGRCIPIPETGGIKVHRSVKVRMDAEHGGRRRYIPRAFDRTFPDGFDVEKVEWVD